jgi:short-subunit dehydrogenase
VRKRVVEDHEIKAARVEKESQFAKEDAKRALDRYEAEVRERVEAEQAQVQLNVLGVHDLVLAVLPGMLARRAGGILISGSAAGNSPIPNNATYAATKAFANTFCESLRGELRDTGVHVTLLAPGPVRAEMPDASEASLVDKLIPDFLWISVEHTAVLSLDGLERNKMRVVPGVTSKAMSVASGYAPRAIVTPIVGAVYKKLGGD